MQSMTGYGKAVKAEGGVTVTLELKSVNGRFFDLACRLPRALAPFEDALRKIIGKSVLRGKVDVYCMVTDTRDKGRRAHADVTLAESYAEAADALSRSTGIKNDLTVSALLRFPDVVTVETDAATDEDDVLKSLFFSCAEDAAAALALMRSVEGKAIAGDIAQKLNVMEALCDGIEKRWPQVAGEYRDKLRARMNEILSGTGIEESRILAEAALFADKYGIDEELTRLKSHFAQIKAILSQAEPAGRKLDFLVQELNREINTVCSKSADITVTNLALSLKTEIEKLREQVQNIE